MLIWGDYVLVSEKTKAKEEITKGVRDLVTFNITIPLGNPNYKLLHTNKFLTTSFPSDFVLENFGIIAQKLNSDATRNSGYNKYNWYVEEITVTNDGNNAKMEIGLNPFATSMAEYKDEYKNFTNAYSEAIKQQNNSSSSKTTSTKKLTTKQALDECGKLLAKKKYKRGTYSDYKNFVKYGYGDCWAGAYYLACQLEKRGVKARILNYKTSASDNHRSVQYKNDSGKWVNFPYNDYSGINKNFKAYSSKGKVISNNCPKNI